MTTLATPALYTAEQFLELADIDGPAELVEGELVEMPQSKPRHGQVCMNIGFLLKLHANQHNLGHVFSNDAAIITGRNPDTVRGADVGFISYDKVPRGPLPDGFLPAPPDLVVEVRSPTDRWKDIMKKVIEYLDAGVTVVCVLDPTTETARICRSDRDEEQLKNGDPLTFEDVLPGFSAPLKQLFE